MKWQAGLLAGVQFETANTSHKWETTEAVQKGVIILTSTPASLPRSMSTLQEVLAGLEQTMLHLQ